MKLSKLFLVGLIALGMVACSSEDEVKFEGKAESTVSVRVVPSSNGPVVRAIGNLDGSGILPAGLTAESAIKQLEVFLFSGESPDGYGSAPGLEVTTIATHIGPKTMVVVANADIGAGSGYHVFKMAPIAHKGLVYAVDIQEEMLQHFTQLNKEEQ